ncbi:hypothetical protein ACWIGI_28835 [Nocardia sp. NPDC055321]
MSFTVRAEDLELPPPALDSVVQAEMLDAYSRERTRELGSLLGQQAVFVDRDGTHWLLGANHAADIELTRPAG